MDSLEKTELTASIHHIGKFLKSGIPIYNSEVRDTSGRKMRRSRRRRRRAQAVAKHYVFDANPTNTTIGFYIFKLI